MKKKDFSKRRKDWPKFWRKNEKKLWTKKTEKNKNSYNAKQTKKKKGKGKKLYEGTKWEVVETS